MTFRAWLSTDPSVKFDNRKAGLVALRMISTDVPDAKLIVEFDEEGNYRDEEFGIVDGSPVKVIGSRLWWGRQERPGCNRTCARWPSAWRRQAMRHNAEFTGRLRHVRLTDGLCFFAYIHKQLDIV